MLESEKNQRDKKTEKAIFEDRTREISTLIAIPEIAPLFQGLPKNPRLVDLYSGTGAGAQAVYDTLRRLGNEPEDMTLVDLFMSLNRSRPYLLGYCSRKYPSGIEETKRNMEKLSEECRINFCKGDALNYIQSVAKDREGQHLQIDLITGFSVPDVLCTPLIGGGQRNLPSIIRLIFEHGNIPTIFTFGGVYDGWMDGINNYLTEQYDQRVWNLYAKPEGVGDPDWDKWILTNRQLELENFKSE